MKIQKLDLKRLFTRTDRSEKAGKPAKEPKEPTKTEIWMNRFAVPLHFLLSAVIYFAIESFSRHSLFAAWRYMVGSPLVYLYNTAMIFTTFSLVFFFRRRVFVRVLISTLWLLVGVINGVLLLNRVTPFNGADLKVALDAVTLIHQYLSPWQIVLAIIGAAGAVLLVVFVFRFARKYSGKMHYLLAAGGLAVNLLLMVFVTRAAVDARVLSTYFGNIAFAYQDYGLPYCFYSSVFDTGISEPHDYSEETILRLTKNGAYEEATSDTKTYPNVIFVQLESFFDPTEVEWLGLSEDPIPNMRKLMGEYSTGYFKVPSVGAGTANTEFEVLTGMTMRSFGPGEYPYKTIMKKTTAESAASVLSEYGYSTHALHNNGGNFYSRSEVFSNMGFDSYTSKEFMNILEYTDMGWAKDDILIRYMDQALDSSAGQDFLFTITVQGHGSYPVEQVMQDPKIKVTSIKDESIRYSWEYYVNQLYETDQFVGNLIEDLNRRGEKSVVVFYGDHLPTMGLEATDLEDRYLYNTEYVIWDNMGLPKKDQNLAAYQLTAEVMNQIGMHGGTIFQYHQNRRKTPNYQQDLELLQYDVLYGKQYAYEKIDPRPDPHMEMGLVDTTIDVLVRDDDGSLTVLGSNFTPWSKIYINGNKYKTVFWNDQRLQTEKTDLELTDGDEIVVSQVGSKNTIFRSSETYTYTEEDAKSETAVGGTASDSERKDGDLNPDTNGMENTNEKIDENN